MPMSELGLRITVEGERAAIQALSQVDRATNKAARGMSSVGAELGQLGGKITSVGRTISQAGLALTFGLTVPLAMAGKELLEAGIAFEDTFAGIAKTIDGVAVVAEDGTLALTDMGEELKEMIRTMALDMSIAATELNKIGQIAGQLGVRGVENLEQYIDTVAKMGVATDLSTEKAAFGFARVANIMGIAEDEIGDFAESMGAAIVHLGNTTASTEPEILNLTMRIAGAGRVAGLTTQEMLGFASAAAQLGVPAERGGTAVSRIFQEMGFAVGQGVDTTVATIQTLPVEFQGVADDLISERNQLIQNITRTELEGALGFGEFQAFETEDQFTGQLSSLQLQLDRTDQVLANIGETAGISTAEMVTASDALGVFAEIANQGTSEAIIGVEEFANIFETDAIRATELFISGMAKMQEEGTLTDEMLTEIGMSGVRVRDTINRFGGSANFATGEIKILRDAVEASNKAFEEQTALNAEAEKRFATFRSQLQLVKNAFMDLGITLFDLVKDDLKVFLDTIVGIIGWFKGLNEETRKIILVIAGFAAVLGPVLVLLGGAVVAFGSFVTAMAGVLALGPALLLTLGGIGAAFTGIASVVGPQLFQVITEHIDIRTSERGAEAAVADAQARQVTPTVDTTEGLSEQGGFRTAQLQEDQGAFNRAQTEEALAGMRIQPEQITELQVFGAALQAVGQFMGMIFNAAKEQIIPAFEDMREAWGATGIDLLDVIITVGAVIGGLVAIIIGFVTAIVVGITTGFEFVATIFNNFRAEWERLAEGGWTFSEILQAVILAIISLFTGLGAFFVGWAIGAWESIIGFFTDLASELVGNSIIPDMIDNIVEVFNTGLATILEKIVGWKDNILGAFDKLKEGIFNVVNKIKDKLDDIAEAAANVLSKITGSPELKIQHAFEEFESFLQDADFGFSLAPSMNPAMGGTSSIDNSRSMNNEFNISGMPMDNAQNFAGAMMNQLRIMETVGG